MARTRHSAKKVTGGKAPRVGLQAFHNKKVKASTASKRPSPKQKPNINTLCVMCRDGVDLFTCLVVAEAEKAKLKADHVTFKVVIFLTTHNDEKRGDLFAGHVDGKSVAFKLSEVVTNLLFTSLLTMSKCLQVLFNPLTKIVQGADIIFYVSGSLVTVKDSFNDLKEAAHKFKPRSMILFDAQHLQLASTTPYLLSLLDSAIVQGFDVFQAAKFSLNDCALLRGIPISSSSCGGLKGKEYISGKGSGEEIVVD
ncbi:hypothetical protein EDD17DRAFT_1512250 [Pisolithus thermaeus]|nr:hypothetical protein EDD17DRAFT_1512250 [Pisolithus thermaeus]